MKLCFLKRKNAKAEALKIKRKSRKEN